MNKKSFGLITTIILVVIFSFISIIIVQNKIFSNRIDKLKYLELQANIYMLNIKQYIKTHTVSEIKNYTLSDKRYNLKIKEDTNSSINKFHIYISTKDQTHISLYNFVSK